MHSFAGWLLALLWLSILPGVAPGLFAALAWIEGSHGIEMRSADSELSVVLTHDARNTGRTHDQIHRHCLFAQLLVSLSSRDNGQLDHIVKFASTTNTEVRRGITVPAEGITSETAAPDLIEPEPPYLPVLAVRTERPNTEPGWPPLSLFPKSRSTVLLI